MGLRRRGLLLPLISSKPILSQVTCGCVCNKPLSWLLEGLFSWVWRGPHLNTHGQLGVPFPAPQVRPEAQSGATWAQGQFLTPESRSTGPGNQHGLDPCLSFPRIINEKRCRQAPKALLDDLQHKILNLCWGVQRAWSSQWQNQLVKWDPIASSPPSPTKTLKYQEAPCKTEKSDKHSALATGCRLSFATVLPWGSA